MNKICRLCFSINAKVIYNIYYDLEIMSKIKSCLTLKLRLTKELPKKICEDCHQKINDIHKFRNETALNEQKLFEHLTNNSLDSFYTEITNSSQIKWGDKCKVKEEDSIDSIFDTYFDPLENIEVELKPNYQNSTDIKISKAKQKVINKKTRGSKVVQKVRSPKLKPKVVRRVLKQDKYADHDQNTCLTCFKSCKSSLELSMHYKNEHIIKPGSIKVESEFITADKYTLHKLEGQKPFYKCNSCGDSNEDFKEIVKHVVLHMYERPFVCKLCGKTYKSVYEILRHGGVHSGFKLFCQHGCGYNSPYPGAMRDHEKRHTDERNYTCKTCGKGFLVRTWYEQHQNIHNNVKPYVCDFCGMAFHMHRYLVTHRNKRHPGLSAIRKYTCTQCSFTCDNKNSLTTHLEIHTENPSKARLTLLCDLCGKGFARTDHLTNHKNGKHYGIKAYSCSVCNKQFQKKFNLSVHEKIHTGEGRHLCLYCGKFFAQKSTLHRHQKKRHPEEYERTKDKGTAENIKL